MKLLNLHTVLICLHKNNYINYIFFTFFMFKYKALCTYVLQVTGLLASTWNIPMFGFVGQTSKMDNVMVYDTYIKIVPPLKRVGEILLKTLEFFGWKYVGMIGGGADTNTWDSVDALWKSVEQQLRAKVTVTAVIKFDTSDAELAQRNLQIISKVARGEPIIVLTFQLLQHLGGVYTLVSKTCMITNVSRPYALMACSSWSC